MSRVIQVATWNDLDKLPNGDWTVSIPFTQPLAAGSTILLFNASFNPHENNSGSIKSAQLGASALSQLLQHHRASADDMRVQAWGLWGASAGSATLTVTIDGSVTDALHVVHLYAMEVPGLEQYPYQTAGTEGVDGQTNITVTSGTLAFTSGIVFAIATTWPAVLTAPSPWETIASRSSGAGGLSVCIAALEVSSNVSQAIQFTHSASTYGAVAAILAIPTTGGASGGGGSSTTDSYFTFYAEPAARGVQGVQGGVFTDNASITAGAKVLDFAGAAFDTELVDGKARLRIQCPAAIAATLTDGQLVRGVARETSGPNGWRSFQTGVFTKYVSGSSPDPEPILVPLTVDGYLVTSNDYMRLWGPGAGVMDTLWNANMDASGRKVSYRWRMPYTATLSSVRLYWSDGSGYAAGNGGTIVVKVLPDDGTSQHLPNEAATPLAQFTRTPGSRGMSGGVYSDGAQRFAPDSFDAGAQQLQGGLLYHLVGENTAGSPTSNWSSWDGQGTISANGKPNPFLHRHDWALLHKSGGVWSDWTVGEHGGAIVVPVMQLNFVGGAVHGNANMETGNVDSPASPVRVFRATASATCREHFRPFQNRVFQGGYLRCAKESGSGDLRIVIASAAGEIVNVSITDPGNDYAKSTVISNAQGLFPWVPFQLPSAVTFLANTDYVIQFVPQGSSQWVFAPVRNGRAYGFANPASFQESWAEHYDGAWKGTYFWDYTTNSTAMDNNWPIVLCLAA